MDEEITIKQMILERFDDEKKEILFADGLDNAIIGIEEKTMRIIYSTAKCIQIFVDAGMTYDEAAGHFEYNVQSTYVGEKTPIWCEDFFE